MNRIQVFSFIWCSVLLIPQIVHAQCLNPTASKGEVIFNETFDVLQGCTARGWMAFHEPYDPCAETPSPEIGAKCMDGTIYAGLSPDGNVPMYTTPADAPGQFTWNNGTTDSADTMIDCNGGASSCRTGAANTQTLVDLAMTGSPAPYNAAEYCGNLVAHGYSDWYLPAQDELDDVLRANRLDIGNFADAWYWSSSERTDDSARVVRFDLGGVVTRAKDQLYRIRCTRK